MVSDDARIIDDAYNSYGWQPVLKTDEDYDKGQTR